MQCERTCNVYLTVTFTASNCLLNASKLMPNSFELFLNCIDDLGLPLKLLVHFAAIIKFGLQLLLDLKMRCLQARLEPMFAAGWYKPCSQFSLLHVAWLLVDFVGLP